jgi:hypothetical protein
VAETHRPEVARIGGQHGKRAQICNRRDQGVLSTHLDAAGVCLG